MTINNRGLAGQPILPYIDYRGYAGADSFIDMTFLDHTGAAVQPSTVTYQLDDITNSVNMIPATQIIPSGPMLTLQIPGASLVMTYPYEGSQLCQLAVIATLLDSVTGTTSTAIAVAILELCAIQTPTGNL